MSDTDNKMEYLTSNVERYITDYIEENETSKRADINRPGTITISRLLGTNGARIGEILAEKLGFNFWHHKILEIMAKQLGVSQNLVESMDEHFQSVIEEVFQGTIMGENYTGREHVKLLHEIILSLHKIGGAVVLGRGGQFILSGEQRLLRVRIIASKEYRQVMISEKQSLSGEKARELMVSSDDETKNFYSKYYHRSEDDSFHYDLVINKNNMSDAGAAELIEEAYHAMMDLEGMKVSEMLKAG